MAERLFAHAPKAGSSKTGLSQRSAKRRNRAQDLAYQELAMERETGLEKVVLSLPSTYAWSCEPLFASICAVSADPATTSESVYRRLSCGQCVGSRGRADKSHGDGQPQWSILDSEKSKADSGRINNGDSTR